MKKTTTLYTIAFGGHWDKFGKEWTDHVNKLTTKPDRIVVITDQDIDTEFEYINAGKTTTKYPLVHYRNTIIEACDTDWLCCCDIDDVPLPNYVEDLDHDYDVNTCTIHVKNKKYNWTGNKELWDNWFKLDESIHFNQDRARSPIPGISFIKSDVAKQYPYIDKGYHDLLMWMQLSYNKATVRYDSTLRCIYNDGNNNSIMSKVNHEQRVKECKEVYLSLKATGKPY